MGFGKRIGVLLKSQLNHWITRAEDPEKIINQAVEEMEEALESARARHAALKFRSNGRERLLKRIRDQVSYWQKSAEEFIKKDMEENARDSLRKRRDFEEEERKLNISQTRDEEKLKEMGDALKVLEDRVQMVKAKRNVLIKDIRLRRGMSDKTKAVEAVDEVGFEEPFSIMRKMEERIEEEGEHTFIREEKEEEAREREEKLINEEIEALKRNIKKGGK
ncbi:MAG TPA: PspA/IM30 family protein [Thermodesulfobacteriota bacterium]|nr:PspA/IM30 family protein [Thermodesulfobacteriota bacterium]